MTTRIIYFDNAATTCPKPEVVYKAQDEFSRRTANPGRGAHRLALDSARTLFDVRMNAATLLGVKNPERLIFTPSCTYSINMALKGMRWRQGDTIIVSSMEHNAVMRPLRQLEQQYGIRVVAIPYAKKGIVDLHSLIKTLLDTHPRLCLFSEASNVTGEKIDMQAIATICGAHKVPLMIDAAQTAGRSLPKLDQIGVAIWCASGHKGLFGLPGAGLLYVAPNVELEPIITGGTGSNSENFEMPEAYPDHLEAGTPPGPAIASMGAGIRWLTETGIGAVVDAEYNLTRRFLDWAERTGIVRVYGNRKESPGIAVISFDIPGIACDRIAAMLDSNYFIAVRTGLHCSPAAHRALGTLETGLVRVSFSCFNTTDEVDALCKALEYIRSQHDIGTPV